MIAANSRYAGDQLSLVTGSDNVARQSILIPNHEAVTFQYLSHEICQYDRPDLLAFRFLGDATQWWRIADANPEIMYWDDLPNGTVIRIPVGAAF